jgi:hypothetical protein
VGLEHRIFLPLKQIDWDYIQRIFVHLRAIINEYRLRRSPLLNIPPNFRLDRYLSKARSLDRTEGSKGSFDVVAPQKSEPVEPTQYTGWEWRSFIDPVLEDRNNSKDISDEMLERIDAIFNCG